MRAIIIHGTGGSPDGNWFPWLSQELLQKNVQVLIPELPRPECQTLQTWLETFEGQVGALKNNDILIGHSIGAAFSLRLLERSTVIIKACFLVSGFIQPLGQPNFDPYNSSFLESDFNPRVNFEKIKKHCPYFKVYLGDNDPYVPSAYSLSLAEHLACSFEIIQNGGHLNSEFGFKTFPPLLTDLEILLAEV